MVVGTYNMLLLVLVRAPPRRERPPPTQPRREHLVSDAVRAKHHQDVATRQDVVIPVRSQN